MPAFAKHIEVVREGPHGPHALKVDGADFPWYVGETIDCEMRRGEKMPSITVELYAEWVEVHDRPWPCVDGNGPCNHGDQPRGSDTPNGESAPLVAERDCDPWLAEADADSTPCSHLMLDAAKHLVRAEAARDQAERDAAAARRALRACGESIARLRQDLSGAQHRASRAEAKLARTGSTCRAQEECVTADQEGCCALCECTTDAQADIE